MFCMLNATAVQKELHICFLHISNDKGNHTILMLFSKTIVSRKEFLYKIGISPKISLEVHACSSLHEESFQGRNNLFVEFENWKICAIWEYYDHVAKSYNWVRSHRKVFGYIWDKVRYVFFLFHVCLDIFCLGEEVHTTMKLLWHFRPSGGTLSSNHRASKLMQM